MSKVDKDEKDRLMNEVLGKKRSRTFNRVDAKEYLETKTEAMQTEVKKNEVYDTVMKEQDSATDELQEILRKQQEELNKMSQQFGYTEEDYDALKKEIHDDFGVEEVEVPEAQTLAVDASKPLFDEIEVKLNQEVVAQQEAIHQLVLAFRRPFVVGGNPIPRNTILISGPNGAGRHSSVAKMARYLYEKQVFISDEVYNIDMSLYTSSAQEQIFLQDLYMALQGEGSVICFENFEVGYPPYLRMLNDLVCTGKIVLNKRYVLQKGQLIEAQTGLISQVINALDAQDKYLVFITSKKFSDVIDAFGTNFTDHVKDQIAFHALSREDIETIITSQVDALCKQCEGQLKIVLKPDEQLFTWLQENYQSQDGAEYVTGMMTNFYDQIVQCKLEKGITDTTNAKIVIQDNKPVFILDETPFALLKDKDSNADLVEVKKELNEIVGLKEIKEYIYSIEDHIKVQELRKMQGLKTTEVSKHMIFTGNPGTGKTTIARLLSRYMKAVGALSQGQLVEVTRADLVGKYVGHTAPLTMSVIKSAIGGVLFVDEAYALYRGKDDSFGLEAIDTIVKAMEDNREDLIIILAGYSKEMSVFLEANSGLKSRFPNIIEFPDYTGKELLDISKVLAKKKDYKILPECDEPLEHYFDDIQAVNARESGNGRLARNKVEEAILTQSRRLLKETDAPMDELKLVDFDLSDEAAREA